MHPILCTSDSSRNLLYNVGSALSLQLRFKTPGARPLFARSCNLCDFRGLGTIADFWLTHGFFFVFDTVVAGTPVPGVCGGVVISGRMPWLPLMCERSAGTIVTSILVSELESGAAEVPSSGRSIPCIASLTWCAQVLPSSTMLLLLLDPSIPESMDRSMGLPTSSSKAERRHRHKMLWSRETGVMVGVTNPDIDNGLRVPESCLDMEGHPFNIQPSARLSANFPCMGIDSWKWSMPLSPPRVWVRAFVLPVFVFPATCNTRVD